MRLCNLLAALTLTFATAFTHAQTPPLTLPLWPHALPEPATTTDPEIDVTKPTDGLINGRRTARLTNVTRPTLTVYAPAHPNGAAALVFPGGGYVRLAWDGEGTATCDWLLEINVTCILVKYRVPTTGHYPANLAPLEDAQQAMRLTRVHAKAWHIDPAKIGVIGFSAGGNLAALMSTHPDDPHIASTPAAPDADIHIDARASFAIVVYPAYLITPPAGTPAGEAAHAAAALDPVYTPNKFTPPTFLIQAENDKTYHRNAPAYYQALADAGIPAELHMYPTGGHGFGIHPPHMPEEHWTDLATAWLRNLKLIP